MIVGVDIGGTKTLLAAFAQNGKLLKEVRFETPRNYTDFLNELASYAKKLETDKAKIACAAIPGLLDRKNGIVKGLGNLPWKDKYIKNDISQALNVGNVHIENDSKLAGLAEARALKQAHQRVFYITFSTGIGGTLLINNQIADQIIDGEVGQVPFLHNNKMQRWETFASGKAFFNTYGSKAKDVDDPKIWQEFSQNIGVGLGMICSIFQVETIIFGGGLGKHLHKFEKYLVPYVSTYLHHTITRPSSLVSAHYADESVIYGCYHYAKDRLA